MNGVEGICIRSPYARIKQSFLGATKGLPLVLEKPDIEYGLYTFKSSADLWFAFSNKKGFDFMIPDIAMEDSNGIELAKRIRIDDNAAAIAFVICHSNFLPSVKNFLSQE